MKTKFLLTKNILIYTLLFLATMLSTGTVGWSQNVTTDLPDYSPGETVYITGTGFQPGEEVVLSIIHINIGEFFPVHYHDAWTVTADADGNFTDTWYVEEIELNTTLYLTATGQTSGLTASTTFTDAVKLSNLAIGAQIGTLTAGTPGSVTYASSIKITGAPNPITINLSISGLPSGVSFSPSSISSGNANPYSFTITLTSSAGTPTWNNSFTVTASSASSSDAPTGNGNLVIGCEAPSVITQPESHTELCVGSNQSLAVEASGTAPLSYQWYKGAPPTGILISGATLKTYTISNMAITDLGNYYVVVSNSCGTSTSSAASLSFETTPPTAICQNITVALNDEGVATITPAQVDNGSNDACGIKSLALSKTGFSCADVGNNNVTLTVTDNNNNVSTCTAVVNVIDTIKPFAITKNMTIQLDASGNATISASQVDNGSNDACGIKSLALSKTEFYCADIATNPNQVILTVTDNNENVSTAIAFVTVIDTIKPVALAQNVTVYLNVSGNVSTSAASVDNGSNDACGIKSLALSKTEFSCADIATNPNQVILTVTDNNENVSTAIAFVTVADTIKPIALAQNVTVYLNVSGNGSTSAASVDNGSNDACGIKSLALSKTEFSCADIATNPNQVILTVTDNNDNVRTAIAFITVIDTIKPIALAQNVTVYLNASGSGSTSAALVDNGSNDACGIKSLALSKTDFSCNDIATNPNQVILTVTDNNDNVSTAIAFVTVTDTIKPVALAQNVTVYLNASGSGSTSAASVDNGSNDACGIKSLDLSKTDFFCNDIATNPNQVILTVTDNNDNVSTAIAFVTVIDTIKPIALAQNVTVYLNASGNGSTSAASVDNGSNDACGIKSLALSKTDFSCNDIATNPNQVILTVTDNNDNVSTAIAFVTVIDTIKPVALAQNVTVYLNASGSGSTSAALVDNGSNDACGIKSLTLSKTDFSCDDIATNPNQVILNVTDNNDNVSTTIAFVTVTDTIKPVALAQNVTVYLNASGNGSTSAALVNNGSNDACGIKSLDLSKTDFSCNDIATNPNQVILTVTDNNDNVSTAIAFVTVIDTIKPVALAQNVIVYLNASGNGSTSAASVDNGSNDACGIKSLALSKTDFSCDDIATNPNQVILTVTDNNDNVSTAIAFVTVTDTIKPVALAQNVTVYLNASGSGSTSAASVDNGSNDACGIKSLDLSKTDFFCNDIATNPNQVILTVTDNNDNASTAIAFVTVIDTIKPIALAQNVTVYLNASGNGSTSAALVDNGSNDACGIKSLALSKTDFSCNDIATNPNQVILTVTDNNENVSTAITYVTVVDDVKPIILCKDSTSKHVDPYKTYYTVQGIEFDATAEDACGIDSLTYSLSGATIGNGTTLSGVQLNIGTNTITWTAKDVNGNKSSCSTSVVVSKRPTTLTYNGDISEQYSDQVNLSATLIDNVSGAGIIGKTITFTIGSQSFLATTDSVGFATATLILTQSPIPMYNVVSTFVEDSGFLGSVDTDPIDITPEDARVNFTGTNIVATASATSGLATVTLRATVQDISAITGDPAYDTYAGDIRLAKVRFLNSGSPITGWLTPTLVNAADLKTGVVTFEWPVNIGTATDAEYTINIEVSGYYVRNDQSDNTVITVYKPTGDFITGGGYIIPSKSSGIYAADAGRKTNFGFNVKYNKKGTNLQGNMNFIFRRTVGGMVHTYQIKANSMTSLGVNIANPLAQIAVFVSKANLTDITNPLSPVTLGGNLRLQVNMTDKGEPGINDQIAISLWDGGTLLYSSNWVGSSTAEMLLGGGNLVVHSGFNVGSTTTANAPDPDATSVTEYTDHVIIDVYPNPSSGAVNFKFSITEPSLATLDIYSITGVLVERIFSEYVENGKDNLVVFNKKLPEGVYFYHLQIGNTTKTGKFIITQ